ncbi:MAG: TetR/AcrR family transcriptional regulator [Phycisphaerales bacterium]
MTRLPKELRKTQLLDAAIALFARLGYQSATTAELAKAAGVTEPIIYRHFRSKKDLFIAVIDRAGESTLEMWDRQLRSSQGPAQRLRRLIGANPMVRDRGRGMYRVIAHATMEIEDPDIQAALRRHITTLHEFVTNEVRRAQDSGSVSKAFSPEITAWTLLHLGLGYGILAPLNIPGHAEDDRGMRVRDVVTRLMLGPKATEQPEGIAAVGRGDGDQPPG